MLYKAVNNKATSKGYAKKNQRMGAWMGGCKAILSIAYSNQNVKFDLFLGPNYDSIENWRIMYKYLFALGLGPKTDNS